MKNTVIETSAPKVGVIGLGGQSAFLSTHRFPTPGETVSCSQLFFELGGKGYNQAVACVRMGIATVIIGAVGKDDNGKACEQELRREGIIPCLIEKDVPTAYAVILTDKAGENTVSVYPGAAKLLTPQDLRQERVMSHLRTCTCLLLQNELSSDCLEEALRIGKELDIPVILNPAPANGVGWDILKKCYLITPNYGEALLLTGIPAEKNPDAETLTQIFRKKGVSRAVITMGGQGAVLMEGENVQMIPAFSLELPVDTTGAGDTFNGYLAGGIASGLDLHKAACLATVASGISVTRRGAVAGIPARAEVEQHYQNALRFFEKYR